LQGEDTTGSKTLEDEQVEIVQQLREEDPDNGDELMEEDDIERASDDDGDSQEEDENGELKPHANKRGRRKVIDDDVHESDVDNSDEDEDQA
jgi:hypothetical protein